MSKQAGDVKENQREKFDLLARLNKFMVQINHCQELNLEILEASTRGLVIKLPYSEKVIGNPLTGIVHGGAITTLLDQTSGMSVACATAPAIEYAPTIDFRIDYMRPAEPGRDVFGFAEAYRITKNVVFTRGLAYQDSRDKPIANSVAAFMRLEPAMIGKSKTKPAND